MKLIDVCKPKQWKTISTNELVKDGYPVFGANGIIGYFSDYNHEKPTLCITCRGATCGTVNKSLPYSYVTGNSMALDDLDESVIMIDFLYYFLQYRGFNDVITGSAQPQITRQSLSKIIIPDFDITIQKEIAQTIHDLEHLILIRNKQIEKLADLVKSRFNEMFGDFHTTLFPKYKIGEKFELSSGSTPSRDNKLYWDSGTINWVKTTEVINKEITETEEKITKFALENTSLKLFPVNTILIAMYGQGQTRGRSAILKVESTSNQACGAIFPNKIDNPVFIWHQLMLRYSELRELGRGGNQPNLNGQLIKNFELILPPLALQNEFADFIAQVDKSQLAIQKSLEELETLKKSLMQEYFG
ncbi:Type I restriction modification DNA specificity domain protein [Streptococcus oralis]|uniref:Type I restriction modification DNA specificity domain protein n=1 Tax=Streptococcus oralis TaxID=1303 RepID=A0A428C4N9_STROR|nr:Type I restriction modification DNA specificity domain protein [Streptococcus oralis]